MDDRRLRPRAHGRHLLAPQLAADLVRNAGVTRGDLVVEIGAGTGVLTRELVFRAGRVLAVELDDVYLERLRALFDGSDRVRIVRCDARDLRWPHEPFRIVANLPFAHTTQILRHLLDDPAVALLRADVIVGWGFAVKRCSQRPSSMLTISWAPWFELTITRRLPASSFRPPPSTDAAVVTITRRPDPLLEARHADRFRRFVKREFERRRAATELDVSEFVRRFRTATR